MRKCADKDRGNSKEKPQRLFFDRKFKEQAEIGGKEQDDGKSGSYPGALPLFISSSL